MLELIETEFRVPAGMKAFCRELSSTHPGLLQTNRGGYHSSFDAFKRGMPGLDVLLGAVRNALDNAGEAVGEALRIFGWVNVHPRGGYNVKHSHDGVRYVMLAYLTGGSPIVLYTDAGPRKVVPTPGKLLILRDTVPHEVLPNDNDERINIAGNILDNSYRPKLTKWCVPL